MPSPLRPAAGDPRSTRRIDIEMRRPWFALYAGIRPTLVIAGRGQPTQWGVGRWQVPADAPVTLGVYLFTRIWRFGEAEITIDPDDTSPVVYRAPAVPFGRGRMRSGPPATR